MCRLPSRSLCVRRVIWLAMFLWVLNVPEAFSQEYPGYYISRTETYPDAVVRADEITLPISFNREDAKAVGAGRTQIANGLDFNAMMYNPALLSRERFSLDVPNVQVSLPWRSFDAFAFLRDNASEFKSGQFLKKIKQGVQQFKNAQTFDDRLQALRIIQDGLAFPAAFQDKIGGTNDDPRVHGLAAVPAIQAQFNNWGVSVYGVAQTGFELVSGQVLKTLSKVKVPNSVEEITPEMLIELLAAVDPLFDDQGELRDDALPEAFAVSYIDLVGSIGYGFKPADDLSLGANLKVVNRRFSLKRIAPDNYKDILAEVRRDFNQSVTGVTLDVGGMYEFKRSGTRVGASVQNIIPVKKIESAASAVFTATGIVDYDRDANGNIIVNSNGEAAVVQGVQKVRVSIPFELTAPLLLNLGVYQPLTESWSAALDWVDVAAQDSKFEHYVDRFRLGTEYQMRFSRNRFVLAARAGLAEMRPTFGLGVNIFQYVQLDVAYAHDTFLDENIVFGQLKVGL